MRPSLCVFALLGALALPLAAPAAVAPVRPAPDSLVTQRAVTFGWLLPPTERAVEIWIGTDTELDAHTGFFRDENAVARAPVDATAQEYTFTDLALPAGRYWWAVLSEDALTGRPLISHATPFNVPASVAIETFAVKKASKRGRALEISLGCTSNVAEHTLRLAASSRGREVWAAATPTPACELGAASALTFTWRPSARLRRGTAVTLTATVEGAGARATRTAQLQLP